MTDRDFCDECPAKGVCRERASCELWRRDRRPLSQLTPEEILDVVGEKPLREIRRAA